MTPFMRGEKPPMKNITINIPDIYNLIIETFIKYNIVPSRSEAVRTALRDFLPDEIKNQQAYEAIINGESSI